MLRTFIVLLALVLATAAQAAPTTPELSTRFMQAYKGNAKFLFPDIKKQATSNPSQTTVQKQDLVNSILLDLGFSATSLATRPEVDLNNYASCLPAFLKNETPAKACEASTAVLRTDLQASSQKPQPAAYVRYATLYSDLMMDMLATAKAGNEQTNPIELAPMAAYIAFRLVNEKTADEQADIHACLGNKNARIDCPRILNPQSNDQYFDDFAKYAKTVK